MNVISEAIKERVRAEVEAITSSSNPKLTPRQIKLINYLVEEELAGRGESIKAYKIAVEALDKPDDFDPSIDSSIRAEMYRLRQRLEIYLLESKNSSERDVRIEIHKGSYRPVFNFKDEQAIDNRVSSAKEEVSAQKKIKSSRGFPLPVYVLAFLAVCFLTFIGVTTKSEVDKLCDLRLPAITVTHIDNDQDPKLKLIIDNFILAAQRYSLVLADTQDRSECESELVYTLDLSRSNVGNKRFIDANLRNKQHLTEIWSRKFELPTDSSVSATKDLASHMAFLLVSQHGFIPKYSLASDWKSKKFKTEYECIMSTLDFFEIESRGNRAEPIICLEAVTAGGDALAKTWALQAAWYSMKQYDNWLSPKERENTSFWRSQYLEKAKYSLQRALELDRFEAEAWIVELRLARMKIGGSSPDRKKTEFLLLFAEENLDTHDSVIKQMAYTYGFILGKWEKVDALIERAKSISIGDRWDYSFLLTASAIINKTLEPESEEITHFLDRSTGSVEKILILVFSLETDQNEARIEKAKAALEKVGFSTPTEMIEEIKTRGYYAELEERFVNAIKQAY